MSAEIGILLVHGIGTQIRGETLVNFGEPIYDALCDRLKSVPENNREKANQPSTEKNQGVRLFGASLTPLPTEPSQQAEPAHVRLSIAGGKPDDPPLEWIIAECHWATSFPPPPSRAVTLWIMRILPWLCFSFFARRLRTATIFISALMKERFDDRLIFLARYSAKALLNLLALIFISPIIVILQFALIALLIVSLAPIKAVQDVVTRINLAISTVLGDCFIFASSDFRQEAVVSKFSRDLTWLEANCKSVVVIAHSQGAAVTYLALKKFGRRKVNLFVSFGAGILKLFQLTSASQRTRIYELALLTYVVGLMEFSIVLGQTSFLRLPPDIPSLALIPFVIIYLILGMWSVSQEGTQEIEAQASELKKQGMNWVDFYASLDPVPNGPILLPTPEDITSRGPESAEVCNQYSVIADHTSYMTNRDEFLPLVVEAIARYSGTGIPLLSWNVEERWISAFRRIRITLEKTDQSILLLSLLAFLFERKAFEALGAWLISMAQIVCDHAEGGASCWQYSPTVTGLAALIVIYLVLRMCVQVIYYIGVSVARSIKQRSIIFLFALYSHWITCVTLSFAVLLYHPPFAWVVWLYHFTGDREAPSVERFQGLYLGFAVGVILTIFDAVRAYYVRIKT